MRLCGAAWAASTTTIAPWPCAQAATRSTGFTVPSALETRFIATTLMFPAAGSPSSASRSSSPASSTGIIRSVAPVRFAMYCHGTKFEWCSSSVTTTTSPGPRFDRPQAYATRLRLSVALRVKMISRGLRALMKAASFCRAPS